MLLLLAACGTDQKQGTAQDANIYFRAEADSLQHVAQTLADQAKQKASVETLRETFVTARRHFKKIESLVVLFFPKRTTVSTVPPSLRQKKMTTRLFIPPASR